MEKKKISWLRYMFENRYAQLSILFFVGVAGQYFFNVFDLYEPSHIVITYVLFGSAGVISLVGGTMSYLKNCKYF